MYSIKRIIKKRIKVNPFLKNDVNVNNTDYSAKTNSVKTYDVKSEDVESKTLKNNVKKSKKDMVTEEQISTAEKMANILDDKKIIKKDKGLIERTESSKIILTEDNRQLLND